MPGVSVTVMLPVSDDCGSITIACVPLVESVALRVRPDVNTNVRETSELPSGRRDPW